MRFISIILALIMAVAVDAAPTNFGSEFEVHLARRWGTGQYRIDDDTYHRKLKPAIIQKFVAHDKTFKSKCGTNPDFMVDRHGRVYPEPQKANAKGCPKSKFTLDLGALILSYSKK